ncbi:MAG: hypothetical protein OJF50_003965 [Nitrospira sp.]|jgi:hypothetical protein|nr:hypothetical protein [Nitrospira sp.]
MKTFRRLELPIILLIVGVLGLAGCSALSGAANMRIDVEVYKGPLSERPIVQWGMMKGHLESARKALIESNNFTRAVMANKGFQPWQGFGGANKKNWDIPRIVTNLEGHLVPLPDRLDSTKLQDACNVVNPDNPWYDLKFWRLFGLLDDMDHFDCLILTTLISDTNMLLEKVHELASKTTPPWGPELDPSNPVFIEDAAELSGMLRDQAFRWAVASTPGQSWNRLVRIAVVTGIVTFSEIGNQLKCRVNALAKQLNDDIGLDRRELPPSVALCDADPTNFVNLYDYFNGTMPDWLGKYALGMGTVEDRAKIVKDLFGDHYWSRINTVYASGRGKTSMAFIKDDVGNWNLKSFDNDPEELLKAYTDSSIEAAKRAAMAIQSASPGGAVTPALTLATSLMEQATTNAFGREPVSVEAMNISRLHREVEARLQAVAKRYEKEDATLLKTYTEKRQTVNESENPQKKRDEEAAMKKAKNDLLTKRGSMLKEFRAIIHDYEKSVSNYSAAAR